MREPQARSTLGTCRRAFGAAFLLISVVAGQARAQIHGGQPTRNASPGWWLSGGMNGAVIGDMSDGRTNQRWKFGSDPLWLMRGTLERAHDEFTAYGVAVSYGNVDVHVQPLVVPVSSSSAPDTSSDTCLSTGCGAKADVWSIMAQFRSGGGPKFHTLFEASAGATSVRNLKTRDTSAPINAGSGGWDATTTIGGGFALPLGDGFQIALVQDVGIGWHSKADLPSGTGRTWRIRSTRAYVRFAFGARR